MITRAEVVEKLRAYIAKEVLRGKDIGLTNETPLLAWGVINSFEIVKLLGFVSDEFQVDVPTAQVVGDHFKDIDALADLVMALLGAR